MSRNRGLEGRLRQAGRTFEVAFPAFPQLSRSIMRRVEREPRARSGGRLRFISEAALAAGFVLVAIALGIAISRAHPAPVHRQPTPFARTNASACGGSETSDGPSRVAEMFSATEGWAGGPLHTSDGGAHWIRVAPPSIPNQADSKIEVFLDGTHAWVAEVAGSSQAIANRVVVFSTGNAGKTWKQSGALLTNPAAKGDAIWQRGQPANSMCFVDPRNGWLLTAAVVYPETAGGGPFGTSIGGLYRTTDGGLNWILLSANPGSTALKPLSANCSPGGGTISWTVFSSSTTGWAPVPQCVSSEAWLVTRDGGTTWALQHAPLLEPSRPYFIDPNHGFITGKDFLLATTSDGGRTWMVRGPLPAAPVVTPAKTQKVDHCGDVTFVDPAHGWCIMGRVSASDTHLDLYRTSDGGQAWSHSGAVPDYGTLAFIDTNIGFLSTYKDPTMTDWLLFRTVDGGATWKRVATSIVR